MRYSFFEIQNFKGIKRARLSLGNPPKSRVATLVGLNESGKTTLLDAINFLAFSEDVSAAGASGVGKIEPFDMVPIGHRSNFNGTVLLTAGLAIDAAEQSSVRDSIFKATGIRLTRSIPSFTVTQRYQFKDSKHDPAKSRSNWTIQLHSKRAELHPISWTPCTP